MKILQKGLLILLGLFALVSEGYSNCGSKNLKFVDEIFKKVNIQWNLKTQISSGFDSTFIFLKVEGDKLYSAHKFKAAFRKYQLAANAQLPEAMVKLGYLYEQGQGVRLSYAKAIYWYKKAARYCNTDALCHLGLLYLNELHQYKKAIFWLNQACQLGDSKAFKAIGDIYYDDMDTIWYDEPKALQYYKIAFEMGNAVAMDNIGSFYSRGILSAVDYQQAVEWYSKAAELGNANAMYNLVLCYFVGRKGVPPNGKLAMKWFIKSCNLGHTWACYIIGEQLRISTQCLLFN